MNRTTQITLNISRNLVKTLLCSVFIFGMILAIDSLNMPLCNLLSDFQEQQEQAQREHEAEYPGLPFFGITSPRCYWSPYMNAHMGKPRLEHAIAIFVLILTGLCVTRLFTRHKNLTAFYAAYAAFVIIGSGLYALCAVSLQIWFHHFPSPPADNLPSIRVSTLDMIYLTIPYLIYLTAIPFAMVKGPAILERFKARSNTLKMAFKKKTES